jgi:precorrin-6B C5,15-methyltransferase / cobalt-precorrin-6B C5,C15-methyltransferase
MTLWLHIIGFGEGDLPPIPPCDVVIGPERAISRLGSSTAAQRTGEGDHAKHGGGGRILDARLVPWHSLKLADMVAQITALRGTPTVLLASGDPLWFGMGATLTHHFSSDELQITPHASSFQYAAARMRWPLQHATTLSLHARPAELLHPYITPGHRILALTTDATTAPHVARLLTERGYSRSLLTILENLGGPAETVSSTEARAFDLAIGDFYVLAIDCVADPGAPLMPPIPGLPDEIFVNDGQLTKRDVRAATLARLAPYPGALLWDVGAGCGSIAIEWMRAARDAEAIAFEREGERLQMIAVNADKLGVPHLRIENGDAPDSLIGMPSPDAIFLGGGISNETLFHACWMALRPGGRVVANAVTLDGEQALFERQARLGGELVRLDVASLDTIGGHRALRPRMPVTQWAVTKP